MLNRYTVKSRIEGSNPSVSAIIYNTALSKLFYSRARLLPTALPTGAMLIALPFAAVYFPHAPMGPGGGPGGTRVYFMHLCTKLLPISARDAGFGRRCASSLVSLQFTE